jgi:hypothetical protein
MSLLKARHKNPKTQAVNIICAIALFCVAHPPFIGKHLMTLLPYLKQDDSYSKEENAMIKLKVCEIISSTALLDSAAFSFDLKEIIADLKNCALSLSGKGIKAAINCLSVLAANVTHDAMPLYELADTCFRGIRSISSAVPISALLSPSRLGNLQRCLIVFGYVCECWKKCVGATDELAERFDRTVVGVQPNGLKLQQFYASQDANKLTALKDIAEVPFLHPRAMYGSCYSAAIYALTVEDCAVQLRSAQALCGVFTGCPRLMLLAQEEGLLSALLGDSYPDIVHERFLVAIKDMMLAEEVRYFIE